MKKFLLTVLALVVLGGVAQAAIPDSSGVIHGCYLTSGNPNVRGALRVIDTEAGEVCSSAEAAITWNQEGPIGATGAQGPAGPTGPEGTQGVVTVARLRGTFTIPNDSPPVVLGSWIQKAGTVDHLVGQLVGATSQNCNNTYDIILSDPSGDIVLVQVNSPGQGIFPNRMKFESNGTNPSLFFEPSVDTERIIKVQLVGSFPQGCPVDISINVEEVS